MDINNNVRGGTPEEKKQKREIEKANHETYSERKHRKETEKNIIH